LRVGPRFSSTPRRWPGRFPRTWAETLGLRAATPLRHGLQYAVFPST
jgi:hypothetical protein